MSADQLHDLPGWLSIVCYAPAGIGTSSAAAAAEAPGPALHRLEREAIAASTEISYPQSELMLLIHEHLHASGLHAAARALREEAGLEAAKVPFGAARRDIMQAIDEAGHQQEAPKAASSHSDSKLPAAKSGQHAALKGLGPLGCRICGVHVVHADQSGVSQCKQVWHTSQHA